MDYLITELVKYLGIILAVIYTYCSYQVLSRKDKEKQKKIYRYMAVLMYLFHAFNYLALFIRNDGTDILVLYIAQAVSFMLISILYRKCYKNLSLHIFENMRMLLCFGYIMQARLSIDLAVKHFLFSMAMLMICLIVPVLIKKLTLWSKLGIFYLGAGLILLGLVFIFGKEVYGALNWIVIGSFKFQPSEIVKLLFVFGSAAILSKKQDFKTVFFVSLLAASHVFLLVLEKDLGGALLFFVTYIIILYCAVWKPLYLAAGILSGVMASVAAYYMFSHIRVRVAAFRNPFALIENQGYQLSQSLFAIGTGGFLGLGLMNGMPESIPVAQSDFIFSAISEEMGGITAICLALICLSSYIVFVNLSVKIKDAFYKLTALGLCTMYIFQVFVNIGGVIKLIPSTGITLPFVSSGGSSVISSILMFSILQGIFVFNHEHKREDTALEIENSDPSSFDKQFIKTSKSWKSAVFRSRTNKSQGFEEYNKSIVWVTYIFAACIFAAVGYMSYFIQFKSESVINNSYNPRTETLAKQIIRGKIYSADRKILAQSIVLEDGSIVRLYPYERVFSHAAGRIYKGQSGIEQSANYHLLASNISGYDKLTLQMKDEKLPGDSVVLTLDTRLQQSAYDALKGKKGAVVVLEVSTGKILAMVSSPDYNPNTITEEWNQITAEGSDSALLNRASTGLYPPGSTFKILTLLEYIRENPDSFISDTDVSGLVKFEYECTGTERNHGVTIHCAGNKAHGKVDLKTAFAVSCNCAFAYIGSRLDIDGLYNLCGSMLFNNSLPGSIKASKSQFVLNAASDKADIPQTVIGLGKTLITPLHNAMLAQAIANNGIMMEPYMIGSIENADGRIIKEYSPKAYGRLMTEEEAHLITEYMEYVVKAGTASSLSGLDVKVSGKTGSAEYETGKKSHAWFIGFTQDISVSVLVESAGSGSEHAVPIAKKIIEKYYNEISP